MATIVLDSAKVIAAAEGAIARIMGIREERDRRAIDRMMAPRERLWRSTVRLTEAEAIKALDEGADMFGWRSRYAWGALDKAKALRKLAQYGDPVTLNEDDIYVLF